MNCFKRPLAALVLKLLKLTNSFENFFRNLILQIMKAVYGTMLVIYNFYRRLREYLPMGDKSSKQNMKQFRMHVCPNHNFHAIKKRFCRK